MNLFVCYYNIKPHIVNGLQILNMKTYGVDIEMPYPATFNDNYNGRELTAGNTEMTMDYFLEKI